MLLSSCVAFPAAPAEPVTAATVQLRSSMCDEAALANAPIAGSVITDVLMIDTGRYAPAVAEFHEMPTFCRVKGTASPTADSSIDFEVWVPEGVEWNGKLVATGNGGYSTTPSYGDMAYALRQGYAVVGGDTGHHDEDMQWGVNHPEKIYDWSSRSVHAITEAAKQIVTTLQARQPERSYYYGCSTGGQQGFAEVQRYPRDFDGVIAGAPSYDRTALHTEYIWRFLANRKQNEPMVRILTPEKARLVTAAATAACDGLDGVVDGVINDPLACDGSRFTPDSLLCKIDAAADTSSCLSPAEIAVVKKIYNGAVNPRTGMQIYPGLVVGSESAWTGLLSENPAPGRIDFWRLWVMDDPQWDWWSFDFDKELLPAYKKIAPLIDQTNTDISPFKSVGGKLIVFHGWGDSAVSPRASIAYFEALRKKQGSQARVDDFARLFMVPGMGHCGGGPGATVFGNAGDAPPVLDADHDLLHALDRWVGQGHAPDRIIASHMESGEAKFTRPICPYPKQPTYLGSGDPNDAASFACR